MRARSAGTKRSISVASGLEQKIAYRVTQVLWDYPASLLRPGYEVSKDFIDCWWNPLPSWGPGTRVIVYCEALPGQGYNCLAPVMFTDDRLFRVKKWVAELSGRERNPDLLKMHYWLRDSLELGPSRPLLLLGQVTWVTPKSRWLFNQSRFDPRCASQFHICSRGITKRGKSMRSAPTAIAKRSRRHERNRVLRSHGRLPGTSRQLRARYSRHKRRER